MSDPRNSATARYSATARSGRVLRASMLAAGLGFGLFAGLAAASAAPLSGAGLAAPGLATEPIAYRHLKNRQLSVADSYGSPSYPSYPRSSQGMPFGGSDEVLELQRLHPETLWPRSMRYFPYN